MKQRIHGWLKAIEPVTKTAERVATLAMQARNVTPLGVFGLVAAASNAVREHLSDDTRGNPIGSMMSIPLGYPHLIAALRGAGMEVGVEERETSHRGERGCILKIWDGDWRATVYLDGDYHVDQGPPGFSDRLAYVLGNSLPNVIKLSRSPSHMWYSEAAELTAYEPEQGKAIAASLLPMLGPDGYVVLLDGKPGVGKTTIAEQIAKALGGRTLVLGKGIFQEREGHSYGGYNATTPPSPSIGETDYTLVRPTTVIIDDIDKLYLSLTTVEKLKAIAKLVILTANNGQHDEVLDASIMQPRRIDETFTIVPATALAAPPPFDQLDPEVWVKVKEWPIAHLQALGRRIMNRGTAPDDLRIDDLQRRIDRKTRSGTFVG